MNAAQRAVQADLKHARKPKLRIDLSIPDEHDRLQFLLANPPLWQQMDYRERLDFARIGQIFDNPAGRKLAKWLENRK